LRSFVAKKKKGARVAVIFIIFRIFYFDPGLPGTDVMIFFNSQKNWRKKLALLTHTKGNFAEKVIITLVFEKNAIFFAENCPKSYKIVIIASVSQVLLGTTYQNGESVSNDHRINQMAI
jgi:hypothetical protein